MSTNDSITIIEKYQQGKSHAIAVRPFFDAQRDNMGLEKYKMTLFEGVWHHEALTCLERNGVTRYVTGLNEFAPEVKMLSPEKKEAKIKEIRTVVCQLEKELAANVIDPEDKDFWSKVQVLQPNNNKFWDKILLKCSNDPLYLDPVKDPFDLIKLYAIEAGGFSIVAKSLEDAKAKGSRFYLDKVKETTGTRTKLSKIRNRALASLQNLYDTDTTKLLYVTKVIHNNSTEYLHSTPIDVLYEEMDAFINGERHDTSKKRAAEEFIKVSGSSMEDLKIRALIKDCLTNNLMKTKSDGFIVDKYSGDQLGKRPLEVLEFLKDPKNDDILTRYMNEIEPIWN